MPNSVRSHPSARRRIQSASRATVTRACGAVPSKAVPGIAAQECRFHPSRGARQFSIPERYPLPGAAAGAGHVVGGEYSDGRPAPVNSRRYRRAMAATVMTVVTSDYQESNREMARSARSIARANRDSGLQVVEVNVGDEPSRAIELGVISCPTTIINVDGEERARFVGLRSHRAILHTLLPLLYRPPLAREELRRQLGSPDEEFPRRTRRRVAKVAVAKRMEMLGNVPLFSGLSRRQLKELAVVSHEVVFDVATTVIERGQPGDEFFVVADGVADVRRGSVTLARLETGGFFGEMSLLDDGPRTATVTTSGPATLLAIDRATFRAVLLSCPDVALSLLTTLSGRVRHADS